MVGIFVLLTSLALINLILAYHAEPVSKDWKPGIFGGGPEKYSLRITIARAFWYLAVIGLGISIINN